MQLILFSYAGAILHIFFALEGEGHYNGCARNKPKHKPRRFRPQTNRITPMLHRKWITRDLSIAIFSAKYETITSYWKQWPCTARSLKAPVTTSCRNMKSCFQEAAPSFHLNCWTAPGEEHACLSAVPKTAPCNSYSPVPTAAGGWAASTCLVEVETKPPENVLTDSRGACTEAQTDQAAPGGGGGGNPDCGFLGWLGAAGQFPSLVSMARAMVSRLALPPAGFNASLVLQTGVSKLPAVCPALFPKILLQHGCCLQSRARGFSVAVHISHFSPQTSFEEKKTVIKQAGRWTFKPMANAWRGRTWQENGCIRDFLV